MVLTAGNEINQTGPDFLLCKLKLIAFYLKFITTWFQMMHLFITGNEVVYRFDFAHRITTYPEKKLNNFKILKLYPVPSNNVLTLIWNLNYIKKDFSSWFLFGLNGSNPRLPVCRVLLWSIVTSTKSYISWWTSRRRVIFKKSPE